MSSSSHAKLNEWECWWDEIWITIKGKHSRKSSSILPPLGVLQCCCEYFISHWAWALTACTLHERKRNLQQPPCTFGCIINVDDDIARFMYMESWTCSYIFMRDSSLRRVSRAAVALACTYSDFTSSCYQPNENKSFHQAKEPREEVGNFFLFLFHPPFACNLLCINQIRYFEARKTNGIEKSFIFYFDSLSRCGI